LWSETRKILLRDTLVRPVPEKVDYTIAFLDSSQNVVGMKTSAMMEILERTISVGINIDIYLEKTIALTKIKHLHALAGDHTPFFNLDFARGYREAIYKSFHNLKDARLKNLLDYLSLQSDALIAILLLFAGLVWFFKFLRRRTHVNMEGFGLFYKEMLLMIISHPFSAALILAYIASFLFFLAPPMIFREFTGYLVAYPLLNLLNTILNKKYPVYLYTFSVVIILYMTLILIASETIIYRILLLLIAVSEIGLLCMLILHFIRDKVIKEQQKRMIYFFVGLHLILAVTGLIANLAGRIILTEMVLNAVFTNIMNGVILFLSAIILNGVVASGIDSYQGRKLNTLKKHGEIIKLRTIQILNVLTALLWIILILRAFKIDDYVYEKMGAILTHKFSIGSASFSLNLMIIFFSVIYITVLLAQHLRIILEEDILIRLPISKGLPHTIAMGVKYTLIVAGFFLAVNAVGIPVDKLTIILGAFSVGIGFGLQNIFSNMVSGLILLFERPIQIGDTVQVGQLTGNVKSIDLRSSNIQTFDGAEVIVPNGQLISNEVINWTLSDKKRRLEVPIGVAYESHPPLVHQLLMQILQEHPEILKDPEPLVFFSGLGESSLDFVLLFWIGDYNFGRRIKSEILFTIFDVLKKNNIEIPFPQRDIHVKSVNGILPDKP
jgi:small-conductance mechanosensitive channel